MVLKIKKYDIEAALSIEISSANEFRITLEVALSIFMMAVAPDAHTTVTDGQGVKQVLARCPGRRSKNAPKTSTDG